jgi:hypothetical protein
VSDDSLLKRVAAVAEDSHLTLGIGVCLRPACHSEFVVSQRVGDRYQVVSPARVGACFLRTGLSYTGSVYAYES